jgi:hypothetical protein
MKISATEIRSGKVRKYSGPQLHCVLNGVLHSFIISNYCIISLYFTKFSAHYINLFHCARHPKFHGRLHAKPRTSPSTYLLYWPRTTAFAFGFVLADSPIKFVYAFPSFLIQATRPAYLNVFDLTVLMFARGTYKTCNVLQHSAIPLLCVHFIHHKSHIAWRLTEPD